MPWPEQWHQAAEIDTKKGPQEVRRPGRSFQDDESPAWPKNTRLFGYPGGDVGEVANDKAADDRVEAAIGEGQLQGVRTGKAKIATRVAQHRQGEIDADHAGIRQRRDHGFGKLARAGSNIQDGEVSGCTKLSSTATRK